MDWGIRKTMSWFILFWLFMKNVKIKYQKLNNYIISLLNLGIQSRGCNRFEYANIVQLNIMGLSGIKSISLIKFHITF